MTITRVGGSAVDDSNASRGTTVAVPLAAVAAGRLALLTATATDSDVTTGVWGSVVDNLTDAWTLLVDFEGGLPFDAGTHAFYPHRTAIWFKELEGTESGNLSVGNTAGGSGWTAVTAVLDVYATDLAGWTTPAAVTGSAPTHANNRSHALDSVIQLAAGDFVHLAFGTDRNGTVVVTAVAVSASGVVFGTPALQAKQASSTADDSTTITGGASVTSAGAASVPTVGFSEVQANCGPSILVRLRDVASSGQTITPGGIPSEEAFGTPTIVQPGQTITPVGIQGFVQFGTPTILGGEEVTIITPGGIPSGEAFGTPTIMQDSPDVFTGPPCDWPIIACGEYPAEADADLISRMERAAAELLYMRSGQQFGNCPITIRPCQSCSGGSYEEWPVLADGGWAGSWVPFLWSGAWTNLPAGCSCAGAHTCHPPEIWLPSQAASITSVKVDGVTLDPSAYRVDDSVLLVRQDGGVWPTTQDLAAPDGAPGTFSITYQPGPAVPLLGKIAAGALALEFVRACVGAACRLPAGVQSIVRQGVEMTLIQDDDTSWLTGVKEADDFLNTYNPKRLRQRPVIYSLDVEQPRTTTWSAL